MVSSIANYLLGFAIGSAHALGVAASCAGLSLLAQQPPTLLLSGHSLPAKECQVNRPFPEFLVVAGGAKPANNEISLEKNVLYFQRTLRVFGVDPARSTIYFANGNDGRATIRYLDASGRQRFKPPNIPHLDGQATTTNLNNWLRQVTQRPQPPRDIFFYFTGHGDLNRRNPDDNTMLLWNDQQMGVRQFTRLLDRLPKQTTFVTMMAQCYSGSFANLIYEGGDPQRPLSPRNRCGFFATIQTLPSVGCTPAVNEADYEDYSSSFFAGLSGYTRTGQRTVSTDYNQDGRVSYNEAHAFAKLDSHTTDLPIATSEMWLQSLASERDQEAILDRRIATLLETASLAQRYVVRGLLQKLDLRDRLSFNRALAQINPQRIRTEEQRTYLVRLSMELVNIGMEAKVRRSGNARRIATLDRLLKCESGSWVK